MKHIIEIEHDGRMCDRTLLAIHRELTSGKYTGILHTKSRTQTDE